MKALDSQVEETKNILVQNIERVTESVDLQFEDLKTRAENLEAKARPQDVLPFQFFLFWGVYLKMDRDLMVK